MYATSCFNVCQVFAGGKCCYQLLLGLSGLCRGKCMLPVASRLARVLLLGAGVNVCHQLLQGLVRVGGNIVPKISFMSIYFLYIN